MGDLTSSCCNPSTQIRDMELIGNQNGSFSKVASNLGVIQQLSNIPKEYQQIVEKTQSHSFCWEMDKSQIQEGKVEKKFLFESIRQQKNNQTASQKVYILYKGTELQGEKEVSGYGKVNFSNKHFFQGFIQSNYPVNGVYIFNSNCFYIGKFNKLKGEGKGYYVNKERGYTFQGQWSKSLAQGKGKQTYQNGDKFEGDFICGNKFGTGKYQFADGKIYEGSFWGNQPDGFGKITMPIGCYEGNWKLGLMHGKGKFVWKTGQIYEGEYEKGLRNGQGRYTFSDGSSYEGFWTKGEQQGQGKIIEGYDETQGIWSKGKKLE